MTSQPISTANFCLAIPDAGIELKTFTGLSGLSLWMEGDEFYEGGVDYSPHYLPTRIRYKPLVVSRKFSDESADTCKWVIDNLKDPRPRTGTICFRSREGKVLGEFELLRLQPVAWRGPTIDTNNHETGTEEIEFVHGGFSFPKASAGSSS
ncbi:phage tail protein [Streptomyces sp. NPDC051183]|uniref:phage tail protein n=1 Tax=unclassified Streptomyces TaxID=2593676 RepID=UPI003431E1F5